MTLPGRSGYKVERRDGNGSTTTCSPPPHHLLYQYDMAHQERLSATAATPLVALPQEIYYQEPIPSPPSTIVPRSSTSSPSQKGKTVTDLTPQAIQEKKAYIQGHRLHPYMLQIIDDFKRDGIIPAIPPTPQLAVADHSLNEFLESQGIESPEDLGDPDKMDEFSAKLQQFKAAFNEEINKLKDICNQYTLKMMTLLKEQSQIRHVSQEEIQAKTQVIQNKFDYVKNQLRTNVCNAILVLQKQYNHQSKKRRRSLSKKATHVLNDWFFSHINDPYPSEEEKSALATQCVLSLNQVNNWFGNKRIRYKRKCLENESRRTEIQQQMIPNIGEGVNSQSA